jgi:WD40 repeat protein
VILLLTPPLFMFESRPDRVWRVRFSSDGRYLCSLHSDSEESKFFEVSTGHKISDPRSGTWEEYWPEPPKSDFKTVGEHYHVLEGHTSEGKLLRLEGHQAWVNALAVSPDGRLLASGSNDQTVRLWDLTGGGNPRVLTGHTQGVEGVAFSPDSRWVASGGADGTVRLWSAATGKELWRFEAARIVFSGPLRLANRLADWLGPFWLLLFVPWFFLVIAAPIFFVVSALRGRAEPAVLFLQFSSDGKRLFLRTPCDHFVLDPASGSELESLALSFTDVPAQPAVQNSATSPDGRLEARVSADTIIRLCEVSTGRELFCLEGHSAKVNALAFSPDGAFLVSGSDDKTVRAWDTATGEPLWRLTAKRVGIYGVRFERS